MKDNPNNKQSKKRNLERRSMAFVTIVVALAFFILYGNLKEQFDAVDEGYNKDILNLEKGFKQDVLSGLLVNGNYIYDKKDAQLIVQHITNKLNRRKSLPNLGELNKKDFRLSALYADTAGGEGFKNRVKQSYEILGVTVEVETQYLQTVPDVADLGNSDGGIITVCVQQTDTTASRLAKVLHKDEKPVDPVIVQLKEHFYAKAYNGKGKDSVQAAVDTVIAYALTGNNGNVQFKGLKKDGYYSVLPIKKGFEYGAPQGTRKGALGTLDNRNFTFTQREHQIRLFDPLVYSQLKEDTVLTVRTPQQFANSLITMLIAFLTAWWALHFYLYVRKKENDPLLLPLLMTLSGICLLIMNAIHHPLTDKMLGTGMVKGIIAGICLIAVLLEIDFVKLFNSQYKWLGGFKRFFKCDADFQFDFVLQFFRWISIPFPQKILNMKKKQKGSLNFFYLIYFIIEYGFALLCLPVNLVLQLMPLKWRIAAGKIKIPEGSGYLILALILALLLLPFGSGPEGSGVKVNLFFFQPSEITKYLIVIFLATFFYRNAGKIQVFSKEMNKTSFKAQFKTIANVVAGLGVLLFIYLGLGDMGPALVLAITFILIYSLARLDFPQLLLGTISFIALLWLGSLLGSQLILAALAVLWLCLWLLYGYRHKKQIFESAVFLNLVIAVFIFGSNIPNVGQRLQDRNDIYSGVWDNEVRGGDQVAQGLWSLSSGGMTGQGLGKGNPNLVPAFHTDMVFTSIGEEMGWTGLLLIVLCLAVLLDRSLLIGRRAAHPFVFYLAAGIAIVTGVQFLVITLGSVGLIPLTGVAVPFLSHGMTSMIINLAAFGIILSVSQKKATERQKEEIKKYDKNGVAVGRFSYTVVSAVLLLFLLWVQFFWRNDYLMRPAYVSSQEGERMVEYNPRIRLLTKKMKAGIIYDRNGLILATSDRDSVKNNIAAYAKAGVDESIYQKEITQRKQRYYPFGNNMFFWLGDYNTTILWNDSENDPRGYIAERRHLAALRGFDNLKYEDKEKTIVKKIRLTAKKYKGTPYLNPIEKSYTFIEYDYRALLAMLKNGINGNKVKRYNEQREDRDITLAVDAALQTRMQNETGSYAAENFKGERWNKLRISVVILNSGNGELLCSANYPLPNQDTLRYKPDVYDEKNKSQKAYTDRDLGLTYQTPPGSTAKVISALAGLQKLGAAAASKIYSIDPKEAVEKRADGSSIEPTGNVTMEEAIRLSSNCYFVNLVNDKNLYTQLDSIYSTVGIRIDKKATKADNEKTKTINVPLTPYYFAYDIPSERKTDYQTEINTIGNKAAHTYNNYVAKRDKDGKYRSMNWVECAWAWGQGSMSATPLNMARIASIVANDGKFVETQYIREDNEKLPVAKPKTIPIVSTNEAGILKQYMQNESDKHRKNGATFPAGLNMGGKTGTPERDILYKTYNKNSGKFVTKIDERNDGWYIFFIDSKKCKAPLAVAIRMERLGSGISGNAVKFADKVVINVLSKLGYIN
jgi:cell division protein FtsW (lipid II flippase)/cell division protein FtsI/penicillin-binding protein 2